MGLIFRKNQRTETFKFIKMKPDSCDKIFRSKNVKVVLRQHPLVGLDNSWFRE